MAGISRWREHRWKDRWEGVRCRTQISILPSRFACYQSFGFAACAKDVPAWGRALSSVLSRNEALRKRIIAKYVDRYRTVRDYYATKKELVTIQDVSQFVPELIATAMEAVEEEA